ncbi:pectin esterase [Dysgonomonas sp. GY75]|uniref:pectinesterase family protein n=1 Tax=Dysgonomonas sp. GY75 TaxID=2780419 RepID=UPI0018838182|nr:pectinesterase family protein [Dysgonomonas sp. GY75]MBF0649938.1 pectin esterase [Dysgonomonas sp. GY75]
MKNIILTCLLLFSTVFYAQEKTEMTVDRNGTGDFRNIQEAINSVRTADPRGTITIFIKSGVYKEKLIIPSHITNIRLIGEDRNTTIINYDDHANINKMGTFKTYTFLLSGNDITLENLTIENSSAELGQAVALHIEGDRVILRNCRLLGHQDTLYAGRDGARQYFENCYIEGTTDFIFGPSTAWFEKCTIHCKRNSYITAANTPENIRYGYIFNNCTITMANGVNAVYLGRPWRAYSMTLFMNCTLPKEINTTGWDNWRNADNEKTVRYMEYNNKGEGANTSSRVKWAKILSSNEAKEYTIENVLNGCDNWNPLTNTDQ